MRTTETQIAKIVELKRNVLYIRVYESIELDLLKAKELARTLLYMARDRDFATIVDLSDVEGNLSAEAIYYLTSHKRLGRQRKACAILANDKAVRQVGVFIEKYQFHTPICRAFNSIEEAVVFLQQAMRTQKRSVVLN